MNNLDAAISELRALGVDDDTAPPVSASPARPHVAFYGDYDAGKTEAARYLEMAAGFEAAATYMDNMAGPIMRAWIDSACRRLAFHAVTSPHAAARLAQRGVRVIHVVRVRDDRFFDLSNIYPAVAHVTLVNDGTLAQLYRGAELAAGPDPDPVIRCSAI